MELEPNTRLFLVVGKNAEPEMLTEAFKPFGVIQSVKVVREKGVAYIKYEKASSAASAIENMHEKVLNDGRGPMVKVMFAESPKASAGKKAGARGGGYFDTRGPPDPDNVPPLSRLFIVVPKTADGDAIQKEMAAFSDMQYCKTDLIASKGIVYCKYSKSSSALRALEAVQESSTVAGYKVKCMLAEPKGKRVRPDPGSDLLSPPSPLHPASPMTLQQFMLRSFPGSMNPAALNPSGLFGSEGLGSTAPGSFNGGAGFPAFAGAGGSLLPAGSNLAPNYLQNLPPLSPRSVSVDSGAMHGLGLSGLTGLQALAAIQGAANLDSPTNPSAELLNFNGQANFGGLGGLSQAPPALSGLLDSHRPQEAASNRQSHMLRVQVPPSADQSMLNDLFHVLPNLTTCELQRDPTSGISKGCALLTFSSAEAAAVAATHIDGLEFPIGSGYQLQVSFAEAQDDSSQSMLLSTGSLGAIGDRHRLLPPLRTSVKEEEAQALELRLSSLSSESSTSGAQTAFSHMAPMSNHFLPPNLPPTSEAEGVDEQTKACSVLTMLPRPVPAIMLQQLLSPCGGLEEVSLLPEDERVGVARFSNPASASNAITRFNGANVCGEVLRLLPGKLLSSAGRARPGA